MYTINMYCTFLQYINRLSKIFKINLAILTKSVLALFQTSKIHLMVAGRFQQIFYHCFIDFTLGS